jgi:hypothetical protein
VRGASPRPLAIGGGVLTIVAAIAVARGRFQNLRGRGGVVVAGAVSGAMNVTAAIGGPAAAIYAVSAGWPPEDTRATLQAYFLALNVVGALTLGIIVPGVSLVIAMAVGLAAGFLLRRHVSTDAARRTTLALAIAGGLAAIYRGLH